MSREALLLVGNGSGARAVCARRAHTRTRRRNRYGYGYGYEDCRGHPGDIRVTYCLSAVLPYK